MWWSLKCHTKRHDNSSPLTTCITHHLCAIYQIDSNKRWKNQQPNHHRNGDSSAVAELLQFFFLHQFISIYSVYILMCVYFCMYLNGSVDNWTNKLIDLCRPINGIWIGSLFHSKTDSPILPMNRYTKPHIHSLHISKLKERKRFNEKRNNHFSFILSFTPLRPLRLSPFFIYTRICVLVLFRFFLFIDN